MYSRSYVCRLTGIVALLLLPYSLYAQDATDLAAFELGLRQRVAALEAGNTWHPMLAEPALSLAALLQQQDRHAEALELLERAVHVSRVNHGLFSLQQAAAVDRQADSHMALGQWEQADHLRSYYFYIHAQSLPAEDAALIPVVVQYAEWQLASFEAGRIEMTPITRLIDAYQLYAVALSLAQRQADPQSWPQEQYLKRQVYLAWLMGHGGSQLRAEFVQSAQRLVDDRWVRRMTGEENALRYSVFAMGADALQRIIDGRQARLATAEQDGVSDAAMLRALRVRHTEAVLELADWYLYEKRRQGAADHYRRAWALLADEDEALQQQVFNRILLLPVFDQYLQPEQVLAGAGGGATADLSEWPWVEMKFDLTPYGGAMNVELVNASPPASERLARRMLTNLRHNVLRPPITARGPVGIADQVFRFPYNPDNIPTLAEPAEEAQ